jgi:hypothetical protein
MSLHAITIEQLVSLVQTLEIKKTNKGQVYYETSLTLNLGCMQPSRSRSRGDHSVTITMSAVLIVKLTSKAW